MGIQVAEFSGRVREMNWENRSTNTSGTMCRQGAADLLEENANEALHRQNSIKDNAGVTGTAAFDGEKTAATRRPRGRKGMEGMLVRHDKSFLTMLQDFYVACLKVGHFFISVSDREAF